MQRFYPPILIRNLITVKTAISLVVLAISLVGAHAQRFVKTFNTPADLVASNPNDVHTNAFVASSGLLYSYSASSTAATNAEILKPNFFNGRWLQANGYVSMTNGLQKVSGIFNVLDFGPHTITNGTTSASAAIQAAADKAGEKGGTVWIPPVGNYAIDTPITIASFYPVTIKSEMFGYARNTDAVRGPALVITAPMSHVIRFESPTATRDDAGGGTISGLVILDKSMTNGTSLPGANTISDAVFYLKDFNRSRMQNILISGIKGRAILTKFVIGSDFENITATFSGDVGLNGIIELSQDSTAVTTQSTDWKTIRMEACHWSPYFYIGAGANLRDNKFDSMTFEAETSIASSSREFLWNAGKMNSFKNINFNRNNTNAVLFSGAQQSSLDSSTFSGVANNNPAIVVRGDSVDVILGPLNKYVSGKTASEILIMGSRVQVLDSMFINAGGITISNSFAHISGNQFIDPYTTNAYVVHMIAGGSALVQGNSIDGVGTDTLAGGILVTGTGPRVLGNTVVRMGGIGLRVESSDANVIGNTMHGNFGGNGTEDEPGDNFLAINFPEHVSKDNLFYRDQYLYSKATFNPPSMAGGSVRTVAVPVTDARLTDFVDVSFSETGLDWSGNVSEADIVLVTLRNTTSSTVDLSSGDLHVSVRKSYGPETNTVGTVTADADTSWVPTGGDDIYINGINVANLDFDDSSHIAWSVTGTNVTATIVANSVGATELNAGSVESELEAVIDLQDLQGAVTDAQVPDTITASLYTPITRTITAGSGLTGGGDLSANRTIAVDWTAGTNSVTVACSDMTTALSAGANKAYWRAPFAMTVKKVKASVFTASSSGPVTIDIHENGTTILSTKITIDQSEKTSEDAAAPVISDTSIANDAEITFDIDAAGTAAAGLLVQIYYTLQ